MNSNIVFKMSANVSSPNPEISTKYGKIMCTLHSIFVGQDVNNALIDVIILQTFIIYTDKTLHKMSFAILRCCRRYFIENNDRH